MQTKPALTRHGTRALLLACALCAACESTGASDAAVDSGPAKPGLDAAPDEGDAEAEDAGADAAESDAEDADSDAEDADSDAEDADSDAQDADTDPVECIAARRLDDCCGPSLAVTRAQFDADPCLYPAYVRQTAVQDAPAECPPRDCSTVDCVPSNVRSNRAAPDADGRCVLVDECETASDCELHTGVSAGTCSPCPSALPVGLADACEGTAVTRFCVQMPGYYCDFGICTGPAREPACVQGDDGFKHCVAAASGSWQPGANCMEPVIRDAGPPQQQTIAFVDGGCQAISAEHLIEHTFITMDECLLECEGRPYPNGCPAGRIERDIALNCQIGLGCLRAVTCAKPCVSHDECPGAPVYTCFEGFCQTNLFR